MESIWFLLAFLGSVFIASAIVYNQIFKMDGLVLAIYRGLFAFVILLPFCVFFKPIENFNYYILVFIQGFVIAFYNNKVFCSAKKFGSGITSLVQPVSITFTFVIWFLIHPQDYNNLMANPLKFLLVFLALAAISYCIFFLKKNKASKEALVYLLPCVVSIIITNTINKQVTIYGKDSIFSAVYYYALLTTLISGLALLARYVAKKHKVKDLINKHNMIKVGLPVTLLLTAQTFLVTYAFSLVSNPAYVSAVLYTLPLWVLIINKFVLKKKDPNYITPSKRVVFTLVISVIVLILAS